MAYRIAGIDVHKRMLAVAVADVAVEGSMSLSVGWWAPAPTNCVRWRSGSSRRRSTGGDGIDRAVLATRVGDVGAALAATARAKGRH